MRNKIFLLAAAAFLSRPDALLGQQAMGIPKKPPFQSNEHNYLIPMGNGLYFRLGDELTGEQGVCKKIMPALEKANESMTQQWQVARQDLDSEEVDESVRRHQSQEEQEEYERFKEFADSMLMMDDKCEKLAGKIYDYNAELRGKENAFIMFNKKSWAGYVALHKKFLEYTDKMNQSHYGDNADGQNAVKGYAKAAGAMLDKMDEIIETDVATDVVLKKAIQTEKFEKSQRRQ